METLFAVVVGGVISAATSYLLQRNQSKEALALQRGQQDHERGQQRAQWQYEVDLEQDRYQRENLAELQVQLDELVTTARSLDHERLEMFRKATKEELEGKEIKPSEQYQELARRFREARRLVKVIGVRIESEAIRKQLEDIFRLANTLVDTPPGQLLEFVKAGVYEKDPSFEIVDLALDANTSIGKLLRERKYLGIAS